MEHDKLCTNQPCICEELNSIRKLREIYKELDDEEYRMKLAKKALEDEQ
jgi:hypothetical protein